MENKDSRTDTCKMNNAIVFGVFRNGALKYSNNEVSNLLCNLIKGFRDIGLEIFDEEITSIQVGSKSLSFKLEDNETQDFIFLIKEEPDSTSIYNVQEFIDKQFSNQ